MKFKRWGTLVPQRHFPRYEDLTGFHEAPVEKGIYAFPAHYADTDYVYSYCCISNGRMEYVKDKDGKRIMMTQKEFDAIRVKEVHEWCHIVISPLFLRGMNHESLLLKKNKTQTPYDLCDSDENEDDEDDLLMNEEDEKGKKYPLMKENNRPRIFNYDGSIWHHLETTEAYERWCRTPNGTNYIMRRLEIEFEPNPDIKIILLVKPEDIIRKSGSWILTSMRTYEKALKKAMHIAKFNAFLKNKKDGVEGSHSGLPKRKIDLKNFEVFIEKVK